MKPIIRMVGKARTVFPLFRALAKCYEGKTIKQVSEEFNVLCKPKRFPV